ncbi:MAG: DUF2336 domain-containing protein [Alphaproteobacteria bacterium]|nr:DUF2336 domain-containing protein [Alphaproteobacteria bacterium]
MRPNLSKADVQQLMDDPSEQNRASAASKIAANFGGDAFTADERRIAEDIFRVMVRDTAVRVREALSMELKDCPSISHDVARALASDVESVSLPVLQFSTVLTDDDLIEIVQTSAPVKQKAIASRKVVSAPVADALVDTKNEEVVSTLVANDGADITETSLQKVVDKLGDRPSVNQPLALRAKLPVAVAERLVTMVSESLREHLLKNHNIAPETVSDLVLQSREKATLNLISAKASTEDVKELVEQLHRNGRLTPSIVLRAVCMSDLPFFEHGVAKLSHVPLKNARLLIHDDGRLGLSAILKKAGVPEYLFPAFRAAIDVSHETDYDGGDDNQERFQRRMLERILTHFEDPKAGIGEADVEFLLGKLAKIDVRFAVAH